jgi:putative endopeptidase
MNHTTIMKSALFVPAIALLLLAGCTGKNKKDMAQEPAIDTANMDKSVNPGADFYQYVNGGWIKKHPVPDEFSRYSAFDVLQEKNYTDLKSILEESSKDTKAAEGSETKQTGDFYSSGMDSAKIEKDGITPLKAEFDLIDKIKTTEDFQKEIAHMHRSGIYPLFYVYSAQDEKNSNMIIANIYQGGINLPDRDYYISKDARSKEIREEYKKHVAKMFELMGEDKATAEKSAATVFAIELKLATASLTRVDLRDPIKNYNKYTPEELKTKFKGFDWASYFKGIGLAKPGDMNVGQPTFFEQQSKLISEVKIEDWKTYLRWNLIHSEAAYLSSKFVEENFNFYSKSLSGKTKMQPRWKRILNATNDALGEAVGKVYVNRFFPAESKTKMVELVNNLKASLKERIQGLSWMTEATKKQAVIKLEAMNVKIGYPDKWRDYSKLIISRESYVKNIMAADKFNFDFMIAKVNKPVDRTEWHMSPQTVNAYYSPNMNEIVFPAAILQPPFFSKDADDAVNYGAIGVVIGHEMTHGFDDQGRLYDKSGNLNDWWTKEDSLNFCKQTAILVEQYNKFKILDSLHVDGQLTLGENIADVGGVIIALNALKSVVKKNGEPEKIDGFSANQRFFMSFAQVWRMSIRDKELMRRLKEDVHSPGTARVNAVLPNIPEFYEAFGIKAADKMFLAVEKRAKIW